jgi:plastocyanin
MRTLARLTALVVLAFTAGSCGGSGGAPSPCTPTGSTATVEMQDFAFSPTCIQVAAGGTLRLSNTGDAPHTFTVRGTEVSEQAGAGDDADVSLAGVAAGTYSVYCAFHLQMTATLQVVTG